jgi:hypothetical protein
MVWQICKGQPEGEALVWDWPYEKAVLWLMMSKYDAYVERKQYEK